MAGIAAYNSTIATTPAVTLSLLQGSINYLYIPHNSDGSTFSSFIDAILLLV